MRYQMQMQKGFSCICAINMLLQKKGTEDSAKLNTVQAVTAIVSQQNKRKANLEAQIWSWQHAYAAVEAHPSFLAFFLF